MVNAGSEKILCRMIAFFTELSKRFVIHLCLYFISEYSLGEKR